MAFKKEYRFILHSYDGYSDFINDFIYKIEKTEKEIVAFCNQRVDDYIFPLKRWAKEITDKKILIPEMEYDGVLYHILLPVTIDSALYPEIPVRLEFNSWEFIAKLDLSAGAFNETLVFNETLDEIEDVTYELEEKLEKAFQEQYKTIAITAHGYMQSDWDVYGILYKGEKSEEFENVLKELEKVMKTDCRYLSLEERTIDDNNVLHSDWKWVCDSACKYSDEFYIKEAKKEIVDIIPELQDLDIDSIDVIDEDENL